MSKKLDEASANTRKQFDKAKAAQEKPVQHPPLGLQYPAPTPRPKNQIGQQVDKQSATEELAKLSTQAKERNDAINKKHGNEKQDDVKSKDDPQKSDDGIDP